MLTPQHSLTQFLTLPQVCARWQISPATLRRAVVAGRCPKPVKIVGGRRVVWSMEEILAHEAARLAPNKGEQP